MIKQCRLNDGQWTTVAWVDENKAVRDVRFNIPQRDKSLRAFFVTEVYEPALTEPKYD